MSRLLQPCTGNTGTWYAIWTFWMIPWSCLQRHPLTSFIQGENTHALGGLHERSVQRVVDWRRGLPRWVLPAFWYGKYHGQVWVRSRAGEGVVTSLRPSTWKYLVKQIEISPLCYMLKTEQGMLIRCRSSEYQWVGSFRHQEEDDDGEWLYRFIGDTYRLKRSPYSVSMASKSEELGFALSILCLLKVLRMEVMALGYPVSAVRWEWLGWVCTCFCFAFEYVFVCSCHALHQFAAHGSDFMAWNCGCETSWEVSK